ncbi:MAG: hypothetical protein Q8Q67_01365 [bacterium]|nr:hypothetical protein [bacterium]
MKSFETPSVDPIQKKFEEKLEASGVTFGGGERNRFVTDEEWFERNYNGQNPSELPGRIFKDVPAERIAELQEQYKDRVITKESTVSAPEFDF